MSIHSILQKSRDILTPSDAWIQGEFSQDKNGDFAPTLSPRAVKFCLLGAVTRAVKVKGARLSEHHAVLEELRKVIVPFKSVEEYNDKYGRTHTEILEVIDTAIANTRGEAVGPIV